LQPSQTKAV